MATLIYSDVDGIDRSFALGSDPVMVGRAAECAIRSDDPRVSRMHARFFVEQGALWVEDLGSSNGIYVGPNKVTRAPVPTGEIVLVGSLMIRLLPATGTLPPPMGLHGTLAQWLDLERKARAAIEEERNAFAKRVGELHEELSASKPLADELATAKQAAAAHEAEATKLRGELEDHTRKSSHDLEKVRLDLAKAREDKMIAATQAGIDVAEKIADAEMKVAELRQELAAAKHGAPAPGTDDRLATLSEQNALLAARAEKAERDLVASQIRAQGAERNIAAATTQAAKAEARAAELDHELADARKQRVAIDAELAALRDLAPVHKRATTESEARAQQLAADLASVTEQLDTRRDRMAELERELARATERAAAAEHASGKLRDAETKLAQLATAEPAIAAARKERDDAHARASTAEERATGAHARAEEADQLARAADTMAKAMAKDVAEALRRAADSEARARGVGRDLDGALRRAEAAEKRDSERAAAIAELERKLADADARITAARAELGAQLDGVRKELGAKLDQAQRELNAERATSLALVDRKTQLERELQSLRTQLAGLAPRADLAEAKVAEYEIEIEALHDRIEDLESGIAVEQTASQSSLDDARERTRTLEGQLAEAKAAAAAAVKTAAGLERRVGTLEQQLAETADARARADAELGQARDTIARLEGTLAERATSGEGERAQVVALEARVRDSESKIEPLQAKADAADLAIGRAGALQRQLDEALQKLAWLERDGKDRAANDDALAAAEARARDAEGRARDADVKANELAERHADAERRAMDAQSQLADALGRVLDAETKVAEAGRARGGGGGAAERELADARARIEELQREVDSAENVRQFAASTEREIAQFQRELREAKSKLAQAMLERDRFEAQLRDARDGEETTNRRGAIVVDPEVTHQADVSRYTALVARAGELERKLVAMEKDSEKQRRQLAEAQAALERTRNAPPPRRPSDDKPTSIGEAVPGVFAEQLGVLEESIDSLRANMRAASDEAATMEQTESVAAVASAVSQAAEHVERARDAVRKLNAIVNAS